MNSDFSLALHALVLLHRRGGVQSSEAMAQNICTNPVRVRRVLAKLKKVGWVQTREGSEGGYRLVADPDTLTLADVAGALEVRFVDTRWHSGRDNLPCMIASGMAGVMDALLADLDAACRARLAATTLAMLEKQLHLPETGGCG